MPIFSKLLSNKQKIIDLYLNQEKSCPEIAKIYNVEKSCILRNLKRWKVKIRPRTIFNKKEHKKIIKLYLRHKSALKVAEILNVSEPTILEIIKKHNVPVYGNYKRNHLINDAIEYYKKTKSLTKIIKKFGFSAVYFKKILLKNKVPLFFEDKFIRYTFDYKTLNLIKNFEEVKKIFEEKKNISKICKIFNCNDFNFYTACKHYNYDYKKIIPFRHDNVKNFEKNKEQIINEYKNNASVITLSKKYKISPTTLSKFLLKEIPNDYRYKKEANILKNMDENFQRYCIKQNYRSKKYVLPSGKVIKVQGYEDKFLNFVFENNLLQENEIVYDPPRFKYTKTRHYYPDFHIPKINTIIEIKSKYTYQIRDVRKEQAVKKSGYKIVFIIDNDFSNLEEIF